MKHLKEKGRMVYSGPGRIFGNLGTVRYIVSHYKDKPLDLHPDLEKLLHDKTMSDDLPVKIVDGEISILTEKDWV